MTDEQRNAQIVALLEERRGCELQEKTDRLAEIDAQLRWLGGEAVASRERATRRPSQARRKATKR
mgnify:CR=1 FL=1